MTISYLIKTNAMHFGRYHISSELIFVKIYDTLQGTKGDIVYYSVTIKHKTKALYNALLLTLDGCLERNITQLTFSIAQNRYEETR